MGALWGLPAAFGDAGSIPWLLLPLSSPSQTSSSFTPATLWPQSRPALNQPQLGQLLLPEGAKTSPAGSLQAPPTLEVLGEAPQADTMQDLPGMLQAPQTTCESSQ